MYHTTGFAKDQILDLCSRTYSHTAGMQKPPWPPILGLYRAVVITLTYLRRNRVQAELAETYDVSQPSISRAVCGLTPVLKNMLMEFVSTADDLDP
jgi:hypothetical protein